MTEIPLDGGQPIVVASLQDEPYAIAVDGENIYWTNKGGNQVMRLKKAAGPSQPDVIADLVDGGSPFGLAINGSSVFWTNATNGEILMTSIDGGVPLIRATMQTEPFNIAVDASGMYWTSNGGAGQVHKEPLAGSMDEFEWVISEQAGATGIKLDSEFAYWTNNSCSSNCVLRVPLDGGLVEPVFPGEGTSTKDAYQIAVDSENLYWTIDVPQFGNVYELTPK